MLKSTITATTATSGKKERHSKTLTSLLKYFEGIPITVELKTGKMFFGTLSSGDESMSLTLTNVEIVTKPVTSNICNNISNQEASKATAAAECLDDQQEQQRGQQSSPHLLKIVQIRGSTIRYIHFPDNADLSIIVKHGMDRERAAAARYQRGVRKSSASGK